MLHGWCLCIRTTNMIKLVEIIVITMVLFMIYFQYYNDNV